ncbi:MAG TPA: serine/threonine-protein kinase, partial [Planctomycetota bacterium]|nr:serine/threonine-protein kinase [Planctomycetota bacterium]
MSGAASSDADERVRRVLGDLAGHEGARGPFPQFDRFDLIDVVGQGATSTVYRARDRRLGRTVAVKILRDGFGAADALARERFRREAAAAAALSHPHVVALHDAGEEGGHPYLVMELVEGRTLAGAFADPAVDVPARLRLLEKAARGVAAAHAAGIVHRDLKPGNILLGADGEPKVGDFGLAHLQDGRSELTRTGTSVGTPLYMAPEQVEGRTADLSPRTDVYALGAILYEALSGRPPFESQSLADLYRRILHDDPAPAPGDAGTVAAKAMEKDPARRYPDATAFADDLRRAIDGEPVLARPVGPLGRFRRRLARHRTAVVLVLASALVLAGLSVEAWRARRELRR